MKAKIEGADPYDGEVIYKAIRELPSEIVISLRMKSDGFDALMDYAISSLPTGMRFSGAHKDQLKINNVTVFREETNPIGGRGLVGTGRILP